MADQFLLTVVWLRHYPMPECLGYLFGVSDSTALRAIRRCLPVLERSGTAGGGTRRGVRAAAGLVNHMRVTKPPENVTGKGRQRPAFIVKKVYEPECV